MKLIKKIEPILSEDGTWEDPTVLANVEEVKKQEQEDVDMVEKEINRGKRPEPKPIKEDMADAAREAAQVKADAEVKAAEILATATAEDARRQEELEALAKENILTDILSGLTKSIWDLVDNYQNAVSAVKANGIENADEISNALEDIIAQEYIHIGTVQGLVKQELGDFASKAEEGEDKLTPEISDEETFEVELDGEPAPVEVDDLDGFHADPEVEVDSLEDGEPAAIDVGEDDLQ